MILTFSQDEEPQVRGIIEDLLTLGQKLLHGDLLNARWVFVTGFAHIVRVACHSP